MWILAVVIVASVIRVIAAIAGEPQTLEESQKEMLDATNRLNLLT